MSVQSEITRLSQEREKIRAAIVDKGVTVASTAKFADLANKVSEIATPDATIYTGSSTPSSSLGADGDIYLKI